MQEGDWGTWDDLAQLLQATHRHVGLRKFQMFACACLRQLWERTKEVPFRKAVVFAERFAEGRASRAELGAAFTRAWPWGWERVRVTAVVAVAPQVERDLHYWRALEVANEVAGLLARGARHGGVYHARYFDAARRRQVELLREIFGDPFRPVRFEAQWRSAAVVRLAETIHDEGEFGDLPVLADALEDEGCDNAEVLGHLRGGGRHVRGCWAMDVVRGLGSG